MKQKWSPEWKSSVQPRKQRKYRHNAPLHVMHKFLGARLSETLTKQYGRRSLPVRKGDEVMVMRGSTKGKKGVVDRVSLNGSKVYIDGLTVKKVDGSEVMRPHHPSNLMITKPEMGDKKRQSIMDRVSGKGTKAAGRTGTVKQEKRNDNEKEDGKQAVVKAKDSKKIANAAKEKAAKE